MISDLQKLISNCLRDEPRYETIATQSDLVVPRINSATHLILGNVCSKLMDLY